MRHGDDYHLWDRGRPVWQALTHLNPMANDIDALSGCVVFDGESYTETSLQSHNRVDIKTPNGEIK